MCCLHPLLVNFEKETTKSNMSERVGRNQIRISTNCSIEHVVFQEDGRGHSKSRSSSQKPFHPVPRCFHTHTHKYTYQYTHIDTHICTYTHIHTYTNTHTHKYTSAQVHVQYTRIQTHISHTIHIIHINTHYAHYTHYNFKIIHIILYTSYILYTLYTLYTMYTIYTLYTYANIHTHTYTDVH